MAGAADDGYEGAVIAPLLAATAAAALALAQGAAPYDDEPAWDDDSPPRLRVAAWGGTLLDVVDGGDVPFGGGEASWAFDRFDVGVLAQAYRFGKERADSEWGPVLLLRLEQRFATQRGLEAALAFGAGAAREDGWTPWFQLAAGFRLALAGPLFLGGEFGFEQDRWFRLGATLGFAAF